MTATFPKCIALPANRAARLEHRAGMGFETPIARAVLSSTGKPSVESRSRPVSHLLDGTCHSLPVFLRRVGSFFDTADHDRRAELSPKKTNRFSSLRGSRRKFKRYLLQAACSTCLSRGRRSAVIKTSDHLRLVLAKSVCLQVCALDDPGTQTLAKKVRNTCSKVL